MGQPGHRGRLPRAPSEPCVLAPFSLLLLLVIEAAILLRPGQAATETTELPADNSSTAPSTTLSSQHEVAAPSKAALSQPKPPEEGGYSYWVRGPEQYASLSGDLSVEYGLPEVRGAAGSGPAGGLTAHVADARDGTVLAKTDLPRRGSTGRAVFACGLVHRAGRYTFALVAADGETVLARSTHDTLVRWPEVVTHVPLVLETYGSDVVVTFELPGLRCAPLHQDDYGFVVSLVYRGAHREPESWFQESLVDQKPLASWAELRSHDVTLDCEAFDRAGYYQVRLSCADDPKLPLVSESVPVRVVWSSRYMLNVAQAAISSCHDGINVLYRYPTTCSKDRDKVRVYGLPGPARLPAHASPPWRYLFERRLPRGKHALTLGCHLFPDAYAHFCFAYVSVARNGAVFELLRQCRPWSLESGSSSSWGNWTEWGPCSGSCGRGSQMRYRLCGRLDGTCFGSAYDTRSCTLDPCPDTTPSAENATSTTPLPSTYCICGCTLTVIRRATVRFSSSTPCVDSSVSWVLKPFSRHRLVSVRLIDVELDAGEISVRDGTSPLGVLLAAVPSEGGTQPLLEATSLSGPVRVDYVAAQSSTGNASHQAVASFSIAFWETNSTSASVASRHPRRSGLAPFHSSVHALLAFLGCAVVLTVSLLALVYRSRCCLTRRRKARSLVSDSLCSDGGIDSRPTVRLLAAGSLTSISEMSAEDDAPDEDEAMPVADAFPLKHSGESPEDYMEQACLFKSVGSVCTASVSSTPVLKRRVPVATVSPQPQSQTCTPRLPLKPRPLKYLIAARGDGAEDSVESLEASGRGSGGPNQCRRAAAPGLVDRVASCGSRVRDGAAVALAASLSELSTSGTEDGFELDYYDYGCHDVPGSFFSAQLGSWPPFLPLPAEDELLELQLQSYTLPPPTETTDLSVVAQVYESEDEQ
ncbi:thrombospondin-1 like protein golden goal [Dermacentor variabilis]|uniref:thrombospondin-1 like protein golden goal n=1 Tax=Dermacentor variabilis TaxID=34621 RepID=UPI003F5C8DE9